MPNLGQSEPELLFTSSAPAVVPDDILKIANDLSVIHGTVRIATEKSGIHLYLASPACLEAYGADELWKMHLAVNVQKYLSEGNANVGFCMKTETAYNILDLLSMAPLADRGYADRPAVVIKKEADEQYLEPDAEGRMVPKSPGEVVPVIDLPADHPVRQYIDSRHYDVQSLTEQFDIKYCTKERNDIFYRKLLGGFRATPQGRLIFYIKQNGVVRGWQARILEMQAEDKIWFWHPYKEEWVPVLEIDPEGGKPRQLPSMGPGKWDPAKYIIAHGCLKSECLIGYDAAVQCFAGSGVEPWCGLTEGPLDAGRFGVPFMGMMGKFLSKEQAELIVKSGFRHVIYVRDKDVSGEAAAASVSKNLFAVDPLVTVEILTPPDGYKDLGEMRTEDARKFVLRN